MSNFFKDLINEIKDEDTTLAADGSGSAEFTGFVDTGSYILNAVFSGSIYGGIPNNKITAFAGESATGKTFFVLGVLRAFLDKNPTGGVVYYDTEAAVTKEMMEERGIDTTRVIISEPSTIQGFRHHALKTIDAYEKTPKDKRPPVMFILDSLGMMLTPTDVNQFEAGDMKGDMGRKPKALTALVRNCVNMIGDLNIGLVATNHTYASQDMFDPDDKISGGQGFIYASSIVVAMRKLKLKEDDEGNKISEVKGIRAACKIMKTRYAKPFESVQVKIPYETGMNPYSGLTDLIEAKGMLKKEGNSLVYTTTDGEVIKKFRKGWERNDDGCLDTVMKDIADNPRAISSHVPAEEEVTE